jgi:hypothetical protein
MTVNGALPAHDLTDALVSHASRTTSELGYDENCHNTLLLS